MEARQKRGQALSMEIKKRLELAIILACKPEPSSTNRQPNVSPKRRR
jgi:hypothetical protein